MYDNNEKGTIAKLAVMLGCALHKIAVNEPCGEHCVYDLLSDYKGKLSRLQVKWVSYSPAQDCYKMKLTSTTVNTKEVKVKRYSSNDIDYFVGYCLDHGTFYIIPIRVTEESGDSICLYPHRDKKHKKRGYVDFEQYRDSWDLLKTTDR